MLRKWKYFSEKAMYLSRNLSKKYEVNLEELIRKEKENEIEIEEYLGPISISLFEHKGRGIIADESIKAGELICVSKAFAYGRDDINLPSPTFLERTHNKLRNNPRYLPLFYSLFDGESIPEAPALDSLMNTINMDSNTNNIYDEEKVNKILCLNSFRTFFTYTPREAMSPYIEEKVELAKEYGMGIWLPIAFFNHSCLPNANQMTFADVQLIRATQDISIGEEVTIHYINGITDLGMKRKNMAERWNFICFCNKCLVEQENDPQIVKEINTLRATIYDHPILYSHSDQHQLLQFYIHNYYKLNEIWDSIKKKFPDNYDLAIRGNMFFSMYHIALKLRDLGDGDKLCLQILNQIRELSLDIQMQFLIQEDICFAGLKYSDHKVMEKEFGRLQKLYFTMYGHNQELFNEYMQNYPIII